MKIGVVQMDCQPGAVAANTGSLLRYVQQAAEQSCELIVFPEMVDVGYDMQQIVAHATAWTDGALPRLSQAAAQHNIAIVAGLAERVDDVIYNTVAVLGGDGNLLERYRKIHLITVDPICEHHHIQPGQDLCVFDFAGVTWGVMTCYDVRFPELARALAVRGAQVILTPAAFPEARIGHWDTLTEARAIENQTWLVACNRTGTDAGILFGGHSRVISPVGDVLTSLPTGESGLLVCDVDVSAVTQIRSQLHIWEDRRTDLYSAWGH